MYFSERKDDDNYIKWAQEVKKRDRYTCVICNLREGELNSHHLNGWNIFIDERYLISNGVTLCANCHESFHNMYHRGNNTKEQFEEFKTITHLLFKSSMRERITTHALKFLDGYVEKQSIEEEMLRFLDGYSGI